MVIISPGTPSSSQMSHSVVPMSVQYNSTIPASPPSITINSTSEGRDVQSALLTVANIVVDELL